jgi:hypothetical protein
MSSRATPVKSLSENTYTNHKDFRKKDGAGPSRRGATVKRSERLHHFQHIFPI